MEFDQMSFLVMSVQGNGIMKLEKAARILGSEKKARRGYSMSINRVGRKGFTKVKRVVAKQVKLTQKKVIQYGNVKQNFANAGRLEHRITSRGGEVPLKEFRARETKKGVVANATCIISYVWSMVLGSGNSRNPLAVCVGCSCSRICWTLDQLKNSLLPNYVPPLRRFFYAERKCYERES